uniref:hypothetical protein n=1 Tax=Roseivirga sp. TaxID=1964215 RepID=UPI004047D189
MKNVLFAATIVLINGFTCFAQREPAASQEIVSIDKEMFEKLTGTYQMTIKDKGEIRYATWSYRFLNDQYYVKKETSGSPDELYFNFIVKSVEYEDRKYKVRKDNPEMYYIMSAKLKGESTVISETIQNQSQMYQIFINGKYQGVAKQPNGKIEHQKAIPINIRNNGLIQSNHSNIFIAKATKKLKTLQISDEETKRILTIVLFDNLYTNKDIPLISKGVLTNRFPDNASSYLYIPIKETDKSELLNSEIIDAEYKPYNEYGTLDYTDIGSQVYNARNLLKKICNEDSWYVSNERKNNDRLDFNGEIESISNIV